MLLVILLTVITTNYCQAQLEKYNQSSGYVDVREGAHLFYWMFYTTAPVQNYTERPLIICLFGSPGSGVTGIANFLYFGPLTVDLTERDETLIKNFNVLFLDSPVGSGFSYVDDKKYLTKTNLEIATDFMVFIQEFYQRNPEFKSVPLYIYGEGYGAKSAVEIAIRLSDAEQKGTFKSNLRGIFMENPWVSPLDHIYAWPRMLKFASLVEQNGYVNVLNAVKETERLYNRGQYANSTIQCDETVNVIIEATTAININDIFDGAFTPLPDTVDVGTEVNPDSKNDTADPLETLMNSVVKKMLKIPKELVWKPISDDVYNAHNGDYMKPVVKSIEKLLKKTNILLITLIGNYNLINSTPGQVAWISKLNWPGAQNFNQTLHKPIWENDHLQGYFKKQGNFKFYEVNRAGRYINTPNSNPDAHRFILRDVTTYG